MRRDHPHARLLEALECRRLLAGDGLSATYYGNADLTGGSASRIDATVDFDWGTEAPAAGLSADTFSARWTGQVEAPASGNYTFYVQADDGVRLWVNNQLLIDRWTNLPASGGDADSDGHVNFNDLLVLSQNYGSGGRQWADGDFTGDGTVNFDDLLVLSQNYNATYPPAESSGDIALSAGQKYSIKLEYYDNIGRAAVHLLWAGPSIAKQIIPQAYLYSAPPANGPTDNPIATRYGGTAYPWTDNIRWSSVFNITDFGGNGGDTADDTAAFNAARDAAFAAGGGVVYFPAGTYYFADTIYLKDGVVIRGATPANGNAKDAAYDPPTNFEFPAYVPTFSGTGTPNSTAFKKILTTSPQTDSNIGIVNVDVNRAAIKFKGDGLTNTNQNIVIFGVRSNNVAEPDPGVPDTTYQEAYHRWSYRFAENIGVQANANVLVANTRSNDNITDNFEQIGYKVKDGTNVVTLSSAGQAVFSYTNHYGISVNRSKSGGYSLAGTPATEPSLFRTGIVIRDNYVYHTMRVAIHASGDGLVIQDNVIRDQSGKVAWVDPTGKKLVSNSATLENRGIDWSGWNVTVSGNDVQVFRHKLKNTSYSSVDGEGILIQESSGGTTVNGVSILNNIVNSYIGLYKVRDINNVLIRGNDISNATGALSDLIYVNADTNSTKYHVDNVIIEYNTVRGNILLQGELGGSGNFIRNNTNPNNNGLIRYSSEASVLVTDNTGFTIQTI